MAENPHFHYKIGPKSRQSFDNSHLDGVGKAIKISFLPAGSEDSASSRIRVYSLQQAMAKRGVCATVGFEPESDVVVVQKKVTDEILNLAGKAKNQGAIVVYDVDDLSSALDYWTSPVHFAGILELADLITTDTAGHREFLIKNYGASRVEIVPDCIDYYPDSPCPVLTKDAVPLRVMWFGSISNIDLFEKYAGILRSIPDVEVVVMTGAESIRDYAAAHSGITVLPWSRSGFIESLQSCQLTCLMHDGSEIDRTKSNNRMITSIHWGVPAAVSRTPEYERTAREAAIEDALFEGDQELRMVVERFRPAETRRNYLVKAQQTLWERYSPEAVAGQFQNVMEKLVHECRSKICERAFQSHFGKGLRPRLG